MTGATARKGSKSWKFGIAAIAAAGLAVAGFSPAYAATIPVGAADVHPVEIGGTGSETGYNYHLWHIGGAESEAIGNASFDFDNPAGITLHPNSVTGSAYSTQLFKGIHMDVIEATPAMTASELEAFLDGVSVEVVSGVVNLQIAGVFSPTDVPDPLVSGSGWTTLRPVVAHGSAVATDLEQWQGSGNGPSPRSLSDFLSAMDNLNGTFQLYGVGVVADVEAVIATITFGGNTYDFTGAASNDPTPPSEIQTAAK